MYTRPNKLRYATSITQIFKAKIPSSQFILHVSITHALSNHTFKLPITPRLRILSYS